MAVNQHAALLSFLNAHTTFALASSDASQPWVCSLFYAADSTCCLYYISSESVRHSKQIANNANVAATISGQSSDWATLTGVQLVGTVRPLSGDSQAAARECYLARFPQINRMLTAPAEPQQALIAERLLTSRVYCLTPSWARLIDNQKGFGHKQEFLFDS